MYIHIYIYIYIHIYIYIYVLPARTRRSLRVGPGRAAAKDFQLLAYDTFASACLAVVYWERRPSISNY